MAPPIVETTLIGATEATKVTALNPSLFQSGLFAKIIVGAIVSLFVTVATALTVGVVVWRTSYRAPGPVNDYFETWKNTPIEMAVLRNDKAEAGGAPGDEGDKNTLRLVSLSAPSHGIVEILESKKHVRYTPSPVWAGTDSFTYVVTNGKKEATANVTVKVKNHAPEPKDDTYTNLQKNIGATLNVLENDEDRDEGDVLRIVSCTAIFENHLGVPTVNPDGLSINWAPATQYVGSGSFQYVVSDGNDTAAATVFLTVDNTRPVAVDDEFTVIRNTPTNLDVLDNDYDANGDDLEVLSADGADNGQLAATSLFVTYTPYFNSTTTDMFNYWIWDLAFDDAGNMFSDSAKVYVKIVSPPPYANDAQVTVPKNSAAQSVFSEDLAGTVIPYISYTVDISAQPQHGIATVLLVDSELISFEYLGETHNYTKNSYDITYIPDSNFVGNDEIKFIVTDEFQESTIGTISIRVANNPPTPEDDEAEVGRNSKSGVLIDVLSNDSDPNNDDLVLDTGYTLSPSHGNAVYVGNKIRYIPTSGYFGFDTFTYSVSDVSIDSQSSTATVNVTIKNNPPEPHDDFVNVPKNVQLDINVLANDVDPDQDFLTIVSFANDPLSPVKGQKMIVQSNPPTIRYTPEAGQIYEERFEYTVSDGDFSKLRNAWVYINVTNTPPVPVDERTTAHWKDVIVWNLVENDYDENGDQITLHDTDIITQGSTTVEQIDSQSVRVVVDHSRMMFNSPLPIAQENARSAQAAMRIATDNVEYSIFDGQALGSKVGYLTIDVMNNIPVANDDTITVVVGHETTIPVSELLDNDYDLDEQDTLMIYNVESPSDFEVLQLNGHQDTITVKINKTGSYTFKYMITDGCRLTQNIIATVTVNSVNTAPIARDDFYIVAAVTDATCYTLRITYNDTDPDNPGSSVKLDQFDTTTTLGATVKNASDVDDRGYAVSYCPPLSTVGIDTFKYRVTDGYDSSNEATVTVNVTAGKPPKTNPDSFTTHWNSPAIFLNVVGNDEAGDEDIVLDTVTPGVYTKSVSRFNDTHVRYEIDSVKAEVGKFDNLIYTITDTIYVVPGMMGVYASNTRPVCVADVAPAVHWRSPVASFDLLANDYDADGDSIFLESVGSSYVTIGSDKKTATYNFPIASIDLTSAPLVGGKHTMSYTMSYIMSDTKQTPDPTTNCNATFSVYDTAPVASSATYSAFKNEKGYVISDILTHASDADAADSGFLFVFSATPITGISGSIVIGQNGRLTFDFVQSFTGTAQFKYVVSDGKVRSNEAIVSITVSNRAPTCQPKTTTVPKSYGHAGQTLTYDVVSLSCTDPDGDALELTVVGTSPLGTTGKSNNRLSFKPTNNYSGITVITFTVSDGQATAGSSFTITIPNNAPVATGIVGSFKRSEYTTKSYSLSTSDIDGDPITITGISPFGSGTQSGPNKVVFPHGTAELIGTSIRFTQTQSGVFSVQYAITDNDVTQPLTASATVVITVLGQPPTANDDTYVISQGSSLNMYILENDVDVDGDKIELLPGWLVSGYQNGPPLTLHTDAQGKQYVRVDATGYPDYCKTSEFTYKITTIDGTDTAKVTIKFTNCVCKVPLDVVYTVDSSGSITKPVFNNKVRPFLNNITNQLDIGTGTSQIRVGVVQFAASSYKETDLIMNKANTKNPKGLTWVVNNMAYKGGGTNTNAGLTTSKSVLTGTNSRSGVNKLLIVITDGVYTGTNPQSTAKSIYNTPGWRIIAIAVGSFDKTKIQQLVKNPEADFFDVSNFNALASVLQSVVSAACDSV